MNMPASIVRLMAAAFLTSSAAFPAETTPERGIGIEGNARITLNRGDLLPKPLDDRTPLILRIGEIRPTSGGRFVYDFHYIGFEPGIHKLSDYLVNPGGSPVPEVDELTVNVKSILPPDHDGALNDYVPRPFPWFGGYRVILAALTAVWVAGLVAFVWFGRRRTPQVLIEEAPQPPSYAERMRPLVEAAAAGSLNAAGQAELERLMTGYWRERLSVPHLRMADALAAMKRDPEAGSLLLALERWLHRPSGATHEEICGLLLPYRHTAGITGEVRP